ncbi:hypothetical protein HWA77_23650 [Photobacterium damselae subsp. damselae]|uniref:Uncharacterized protein n=1 Tax=Photobacterium damselae subsp. damselae TaxID=85581 RepID=A0A850QX60_PHODD|nr:hypothetical protein [Photobacterium damselae subsp. damselae]
MEMEQNNTDLEKSFFDGFLSYLDAKWLQIGDVGIPLLIVIIMGFLLSGYFLLNKRSGITLFWAKLTHSSYGQLFLTSIGILWASIISVFGGKLQEQWFEGKSWGTENLVFGISVIMALLLSVLHYIYSQIKEQHSQSRPSYDSIHANSMHSVNVTSIVNSCMLDLKDAVTKEKRLKGSFLGDDESTEKYNTSLDNALTTCMESILLVTKRIGEGNDDITVKSNIFNLIPSAAAHASFINQGEHKQDGKAIFTKDSIDNSPFFLFSSNFHSRLEHCKYILACDQSYTCKIDRNNKFEQCGKSEKQDFPAICMPVSFSEYISEGKLAHPNMFGAPEAITNNREVYIGNISEYVDQFFNDLKKSPDYKEHITGHYERSIRTYYAKDKDKPRSILSIPIGKFNLNVNKLNYPVAYDQQACVLNIYVNRINFLENELKSEAFYSMLRPLCHNLSMLISLKIAYTSMLKVYNEKNKVVKVMSQAQAKEVVNG